MSHDGTVLGMEAEIERLRDVLRKTAETLRSIIYFVDHQVGCDERTAGECTCWIGDDLKVLKEAEDTVDEVTP